MKIIFVIIFVVSVEVRFRDNTKHRALVVKSVHRVTTTPTRHIWEELLNKDLLLNYDRISDCI